MLTFCSKAECFQMAIISLKFSFPLLTILLTAWTFFLFSSEGWVKIIKFSSIIFFELTKQLLSNFSLSVIFASLVVFLHVLK